ncbi:hypothetical protein LTR96_011008 [Exophiala xenobiotica]|nr:hypothetical protein LTR72_010981 [Exophiala xenobiotica]KAK5263577.1 hypothetical protein LTR96_011008 [Exophiala xenobiotica]KAK5285326.1 hypothetical protein LTR14_011019 [Exophiala xenobiotica]KAK5313395.1 hypothetical protein LTR93_010908 [Exophiala xenobiotica]KAK5332953.1 hypothetical protein LTR98_010952 [Exophiala xenobiotica]
MGLLEATLLQMGGGPLENMGRLDALRWWSLGNWAECVGAQDLRPRRLFGLPLLQLLTPVDKIEDGHNYTTVTTRSAASLKARKVVCTIPLNVLEFSSKLPSLTQQAISNGWTQKCNKVHFEIAGSELASWTSFASPGKGLICALGEKTSGSRPYSWWEIVFLFSSAFISLLRRRSILTGTKDDMTYPCEEAGLIWRVFISSTNPATPL